MEQSPNSGGDGRRASIRVRVTVAEKDALEQAAMQAGLTLSDWVRSKAIGSKPVFRKPTPERELMLRFLSEFGKTGSNLNQIARHMNRKQNSPEFVIPLELVTYAVNELRALADQLRKQLEHGGR